MTISTQVSSINIRGNGVQTSFTYNFLIPYQADGSTPAVTVTLVLAADGSESVLDPSAYGINDVGEALGGTVDYPLVGDAITADYYLNISRSLDYDQPFAISNQSFYPHTVEQLVDYIEQQIQQIKTEVSRSVRSSLLDTGSVTPSFASMEGQFLGIVGGEVVGIDGSAPATPLNASLVTYDPLGGTAISQQSWNRQFVSVRGFGAACDGVTDDTVAVQACVTWCAANGWPSVLVPGLCLLTSTININRLVDTSSGKFHWYGIGPKGGFYTTTAIVMFGSTLTFSTAPVSELVTFHQIQFECASAATAAYVACDKFLRIEFDNCFFYKIKCVNGTAAYLQSWYFTQCYATAYTGWMVIGVYATDLKWDFQVEAGGQGVKTTTFIVGAEFLGIFEGSTGPICQTGTGFSRGIKVALRYSEGNTNPDFKFGVGGGTLQGLTVENVFTSLSALNYADPTFWNIELGIAYGVMSQGNWCSGQIYNDDSVPLGELFTLDISGVAVQKSTKIRRLLPGGWTASNPALTAHAGGGRASAVPLVAGLNRCIVCATNGDSFILPDISGTYGQEVTLVQFGVKYCQVFAPGSVKINFAIDGSVGVPQQGGSIVTYYAVTADRWECGEPQVILLASTASYADDAAAATGGVPIGGKYRNGSVLQIRVA